MVVSSMYMRSERTKLYNTSTIMKQSLLLGENFECFILTHEVKHSLLNTTLFIHIKSIISPSSDKCNNFKITIENTKIRLVSK